MQEEHSRSGSAIRLCRHEFRKASMVSQMLGNAKLIFESGSALGKPTILLAGMHLQDSSSAKNA